MTPAAGFGSASASDARARILRTAYDLFCRHGLQAVGIDRIIAEAGVAKMTLYRQFRSKDDLVLAVLQLRQELWTWGWLASEVERRGRTPEGRLLAIFDAFDDWFRQDGFEGCLFMNSLLESHDRKSPVGAASVMGLADVRSLIRRLAEEAGVANPEAFARQWQMLMWGAIVDAGEGDILAAKRARDLGSLLIERELPPA